MPWLLPEKMGLKATAVTTMMVLIILMNPAMKPKAMKDTRLPPSEEGQSSFHEVSQRAAVKLPRALREPGLWKIENRTFIWPKLSMLLAGLAVLVALVATHLAWASVRLGVLPVQAAEVFRRLSRVAAALYK